MMLSLAPAHSPAVSRHLSTWADRFDLARLPVLAATATTIEAMRANEDAVDAHALAKAVESDPLMALKLLSHVGSLRRGRDGGEPETVTAALVMLGIPPFFRAFAPLDTVDSRLRDDPRVREGFDAVLRRAHRASGFAIGFAVQRLDRDAAVLRLAALLHDFAELLLWLESPDEMLEMARRQEVDPQLRSAEVQRQVLGITLPELQHALMLRWRLPSILTQMSDDSLQKDSPQVRNVLLAIRLARHTALGWDNPALSDDVREIANLLHLGTEPALQLLRDIDG